MPCCVNGVLSYALLDTGAEATIISNDIYHCINTYTSKLEPPLRPVFGANNLPLDVVGETELTLELGSIKVQHKVLVSHGLPQHVVTRDGISTDPEKVRVASARGRKPTEGILGNSQLLPTICAKLCCHCCFTQCFSKG